VNKIFFCTSSRYADEKNHRKEREKWYTILESGVRRGHEEGE